MVATNALNITDNGFQSFNSANGLFHGRTLTGAGGIVVTNGDGLSGNPVITGTGPATDLHVARFIVASSTGGTGANFTTIASAIAAAQGTGIPSTIFIQPGTFNENLTFQANITISCLDEGPLGSVNIVGNHTFSTGGNISFFGLRFTSSNSTTFTLGGASQQIMIFSNCEFVDSGQTLFSFTNSNANSFLMIDYCNAAFGDANAKFISSTSPGTIEINYSYFRNPDASGTLTFTSTASTCSAGKWYQTYTDMALPITTSGTANLYLYKCNFGFDGSESSTNQAWLVIGGSGTNVIDQCYFSSGSSLAISVGSATTITNSTIKTSNAAIIGGASSVSYGNIISSGSTSTITTTTQVPLVCSNNAVKITTPGAYPYTTIPQDGVILVDTSSARTIAPLASPTTGQMHIIKDNVGSAGTNPITITPSGKNIDGGASFTINTNYGSATICFSGSEWSLL